MGSRQKLWRRVIGRVAVAILLVGLVDAGAANVRVPRGNIAYHGGPIMPTAVTKAILLGTALVQ